MDIVGHSNERRISRTMLRNSSRETLSRDSVVAPGIFPVVRVEVEIDVVVPEFLEVREHLIVPAGEREAYVRREETEDVGEGDLNFEDLIAPLLRTDGLEVLVAPGVACDLVAFPVHALDGGWEAGALVLYLAFSAVGCRYEEGRLRCAELLISLDTPQMGEYSSVYLGIACLQDVQ